MLHKILFYKLLKDEKFRNKYKSLLSDFIEYDDMQIGKGNRLAEMLLTFWFNHDDTQEDYPNFIYDILKDCDLSSEEIVRMISDE